MAPGDASHRQQGHGQDARPKAPRTLVVGASAAALQIALERAQQGLRVTVFEARPGLPADDAALVPLARRLRAIAGAQLWCGCRVTAWAPVTPGVAVRTADGLWHAGAELVWLPGIGTGCPPPVGFGALDEA